MAEWASNFNIGNNEEYAQGFFEASTIYLEHLRKYINDFNITGNIKIWTAGYSRGGATVNLAAGRIDDGLVNGENILSDNVKYTKDDIYAYSFEPPAGKIIKSDDNEIFEKGINYSNIYCILNLNDPVPFVAPSDFNFIRYGTDLFLPDIITDLEYEKHLDLVKSRMKDLTNYDVIGDYKIDQFKDESIVSFLNKIKSPYVNVTPYMYLNDFISTLCSALGSKDKYVEVLQNTVMELFKFLYSHVSAKESAINLAINFGKSILLNDSDEVLLYDLQNNPGRLLDDLDPLLLSAFKKIDVNLSMNDVKILTKQLLIVLVNILFSENGFVKLRTLINMTNVGILGSAHIPELLLTHITSLDDNYESSDLVIKNSFNILYLTTDSEFELRINDDKYIYFDDGNINSKLAIKISGNTYMIYIPENTEFEISSNGSYSYELYNHNNSYLNDKLIKQFNN